MLRALSTTPGRLRLTMSAVVVAGLAFGVFGLVGLLSRAAALESARSDAADQIRLETARTKLVIADAAAGVDVLAGRDQQLRFPHDYAYALQPAVIAAAIATREPDDTFALAVAQWRLTQYAGDVDGARTLASHPSSTSQKEAADQLNRASLTMRTEVLGRLAAVQSASEQRLQRAQTDARSGSAAALATAVLALLVLAGAHWWLTLRTRRMVNVGLAAALLLLVAVTATGVVVVLASQRAVADVQDGPHQVTRWLAEARIDAFTARSDESLGVLTDRLADTEAPWRASMAAARTALAKASASASPSAQLEIRKISDSYLAAYETVHAEKLVGAVSRVAAVESAISPGTDGAVGSFEDVDAFSGALLARQSRIEDDGWATARSNIVLAAWLCLAGGLGAALFGGLGITPRLQEYR